MTTIQNQQELETCNSLRINQTAALLKVSRKTIYRWIAAGQFVRPIRLSSRIVVFNRAELLAWMQSRRDHH